MEIIKALGATVISALTSGLPSVVLTVLICLVVAKYLLAFLGKAIDRSPLETTLARFLKPALRVAIYFLAGIIIAAKLGVDTSSVVAIASVFSAAFALAAQDALGNLFGGTLLLWTKPFVAGDYIITGGGAEGTVQEINLFYTTLVMIDNRHVTLPNGTLSGETITNCTTMGKRRMDLEIGVSFDTPIETAKQAFLEAVEMTDGTLAEPQPPFVGAMKFGENSVTYVLRVWTKTADYWTIYFALMENLKRSFDKHGVKTAYNRTTVHKAE